MTLKVLVTGSHGLIGSTMVSTLKSEGHEVVQLSRTPSSSEGTVVLWDPGGARILNRNKLEGMDVVIHLAGENIGTERWTPQKKAAIRNSRVQGTGLLAQTIAELEQPPRLFISASAIGFYGDCGEEYVREDHPQGQGFLAGVCRDWEEATALAMGKGIRIVRLRMGFVLSPGGGGLAKMLPPFRMGLGAVIGSGKQWMSWISIEDVVGIMRHIMDHEDVEGPINAVSPNPVTNAEFTKTLGKVLRRPTFLRMPSFAARRVIGEMADDLLLAGARVVPTRIETSGYVFKYPDL